MGFRASNKLTIKTTRDPHMTRRAHYREESRGEYNTPRTMKRRMLVAYEQSPSYAAVRTQDLELKERRRLQRDTRAQYIASPWCSTPRTPPPVTVERPRTPCSCCKPYRDKFEQE